MDMGSGSAKVAPLTQTEEEPVGEDEGHESGEESESVAEDSKSETASESKDSDGGGSRQEKRAKQRAAEKKKKKQKKRTQYTTQTWAEADAKEEAEKKKEEEQQEMMMRHTIRAWAEADAKEEAEKKRGWRGYEYVDETGFVQAHFIQKDGKAEAATTIGPAMNYYHNGERCSGELEYFYRALGFKDHFAYKKSSYEELRRLLEKEKGIRLVFTATHHDESATYGEMSVVMGDEGRPIKTVAELRRGETLADAKEQLEAVLAVRAIKHLAPPGTLSGVQIIWKRLPISELEAAARALPVYKSIAL